MVDPKKKKNVGQYARMRGSVKHPVNTHPGNHLYSVGSSSLGPKDLDSVLPKNTIKLTCFPRSVKTQPEPPTFSSSSLETTDAMALNLDQHAKLVIEISQPRVLQSFRSLTSLRSSSSGTQPRDRVIRHAISQPNLLQRSSSSVLGLRRSASPDSMSFGSSKKRRADSVCGGGRDMDDMSTKMTSSSSVAATAAAAVVAAAAASAAASSNSSSSGSNLQLIGTDYSSTKEPLGLGLSSSASSSPAIEALAVARASSYVPLEEQKELGIDYSLFTRVETAGWRILIPPNVTAAFRSEDFGLVLKPKGGEGVEVEEVAVEGEQEVGHSEAMTNEEDIEHVQGDVVQTEASMDAGQDVMGDGGSHKEVQVSSAVDVDVTPAGSVAEGMEIEEEMDELEDD